MIPTSTIETRPIQSLNGKANSRQNAIVEISPADLTPGRLAELFENGVRAALLVRDPRVSWLWNQVMEVGYSPGSQPWNASFRTLAKNHHKGDQALGDMMRFVPSGIGHIARKLMIFRKNGNEDLCTLPEFFYNEDGQFTVPDEIVSTAWEIMSDILVSTCPMQKSPDAVSLEQLKYPDSFDDLQKSFSILADSGGAWVNAGQRVDGYRQLATGPFRGRYARNIFGLLSMVPGLRNLLHGLNQACASNDRSQIDSKDETIGEPHIDAGKLVTTIASERDILRTQIYDGARWIDLPMESDTLAILPGGELRKSTNIKPTRHRVLIDKNGHRDAQCLNATLVLAAINRPANV